MKKKKYNTGGPISPNYQSLGNIKFDSNKARQGDKGQLIVRDENSGKDYGVIRKQDGSYDWYQDPVLDKDVVKSTVAFTKDYYNSPKAKERHGKATSPYYPFDEVDQLLTNPENKSSNVAEYKIHDIAKLDWKDPKWKTFFEKGAHYNTKSDEVFISSNSAHSLSGSPYATAAHELSHLANQGRKGISLKDDLVFHEVKNNPKKMHNSSHDDSIEEYKADIDALRYLLYRNGIYDAKTDDFTKEHLNQAKDKLKDEFIFKRLIQNTKSEDELIKAMNYLTNNTKRDKSQYAAYGGKLDVQSKENINSILGAVSGIAPMFGPVGVGVGAAAMVGSNFLTNNIEKQKMGPHLANFSGYADGGKIKKSVSKRISPMTPAEKQALAVEYGLKKDGTKGIEKTMEAIASLNPLSNSMSFLAKDERNAMDYVSLIPGVKAASALGATANTLSKTSRQARSVRNAQTALRSLDYVDPVVPFIEGGKSHYATGGPVDPPNIQYVTLGDRKIKFDSNQGVPLMLGGKPMSNKYAIKDLDTQFWIDVDRDPISGAYLPATGTVPRFQPDNIINNRSGGGGESSKSKSKYRFREMADGGFIGINSSSFKVDGDPNQKDSEFYAPKGVYLDDEEVVKNDSFVFSNRIKNPNTLRTFAKDAQRIEAATKKAEDKSKRYGDNISENTIKYNNMVVDKLAESQEFIATIKGLRNDSKMMATGGPFDPLPGQQFMSTPYSDVFYDPYNKRLVKRLPNGEYINKVKDANDASYIPNQEAVNTHLQSYPDPMANPVDIVAKRPKAEIPNFINPINPVTGLPYMGNGRQARPSGPVSQEMSGYDPMTGVNKYDVGFNGPQGSVSQGNSQPINLDPTTGIPTYVPPSPVTNPTNPKATSPVNKIPTKATAAPTSTTGGMDWRVINDVQLPNYMPVYPLDQLPTGINIAPYSTPLGQVQSNSTTPLDLNKFRIPSQAATTDLTGQVPSTGFNTKFTPGDYMQMIAMGSRFLNIGSSEVDRPNLDTTNISKNSYDQAPVLQQNNRNYQNALNNTNTTSPNLRRALANQMYATKLQQDSNVMDQYQQMNNQANMDYENRLSNQNRFNAQQTSYTQDINARNRAALRNARQTAYDQIGTAGMMLNDKKQADSYVQALKIRYPDIADNVLKDILYGK